MKRKNLILGLFSAVVMLLFPWIAVTFVRSDGGMAICFILFFAVNPAYSVGVGIFSGRNMKTAWFQPLLSAILFLAGVWLLFDRGEPAFLLYTAAYLAIGVLTMLAASFIAAKKR